MRKGETLEKKMQAVKKKFKTGGGGDSISSPGECEGDEADRISSDTKDGLDICTSAG